MAIVGYATLGKSTQLRRSCAPDIALCIVMETFNECSSIWPGKQVCGLDKHMNKRRSMNVVLYDRCTD